jgi:hypothetical protein
LVVMGISLATGGAFAADSRNVSVINETGYAIRFLASTAPTTASTSGITSSKKP